MIRKFLLNVGGNDIKSGNLKFVACFKVIFNVIIEMNEKNKIRRPKNRKTKTAIVFDEAKRRFVLIRMRDVLKSHPYYSFWCGKVPKMLPYHIFMVNNYT